MPVKEVISPSATAPPINGAGGPLLGWGDIAPDISHIMTEDDTPVDNFASEKNQRLLVETIYNSNYYKDRPVVAAANVGIFVTIHGPTRVPDVFLSLDTAIAKDWWEKHNRAYFFWEFGKPPDLVIEIVSNKEGEELGEKFLAYRRMGVPYYVVFDPQKLLSQHTLLAFQLSVAVPRYEQISAAWLPGVGIGLTTWHGVFEQKEELYLRWCDQQGILLPNAEEIIIAERNRAEQEHNRAEQERNRAEKAEAELAALRLKLGL